MSKLPAEFAELEQFSDWIFDTEPPRYAKRLSSSMDELKAFYDAAFPRLQDAMAYIDKFDLKALPEDAKNLEMLYFGFINITFPIEVWGQQRVPDSGAAQFPCVQEFPY
jgi:hypothetical protein